MFLLKDISLRIKLDYRYAFLLLITHYFLISETVNPQFHWVDGEEPFYHCSVHPHCTMDMELGVSWIWTEDESLLVDCKLCRGQLWVFAKTARSSSKAVQHSFVNVLDSLHLWAVMEEKFSSLHLDYNMYFSKIYHSRICTPFRRII